MHKANVSSVDICSALCSGTPHFDTQWDALRECRLFIADYSIAPQLNRHSEHAAALSIQLNTECSFFSVIKEHKVLLNTRAPQSQFKCWKRCRAVTKSLGKCKQLIGKRLNLDSDQTLYWREPRCLDPASQACWNNAVHVPLQSSRRR